MAKVEKLLKKFRIVFEDKNFYEAHQVARTIYYRWLEQAEYEKLAEFLYEKVMDFTKVNETMIVFDLADLYAKVLTQGSLPLDEARLEEVMSMFSTLVSLTAFGPNTKQLNSLLVPITDQLINWSSDSPSASLIERQYGNARLNQVFAKAFEANNQPELAKKHYVCSKDPYGYAKLIVQNMGQSSTSEDTDEEDLSDESNIIAVAVLQVLSIGRLGVATKLLHLLTDKYPNYSAKPPYASALLNFTWLLTLSVQLRSLSYFTELVETYRPILTRDSKILFYVDKIGQKFFQMPEKKRNSGGMLGKLLKGMVTEKRPKIEFPADFRPDDSDLLAEFKITDQGYHAAWKAASARNPPDMGVEAHLSDTSDEPDQKDSSKSNVQEEMDLD